MISLLEKVEILANTSLRISRAKPAASRELAAYMHGETLPSDQRSWCLVMADQYAIGWAKGDGNVLKNHYPKGLRR